MRLSRLKTGSRKYGQNTPLPTFRPISVFFHKYKNTSGTGRNFVRPFSSAGRRWGNVERFVHSSSWQAGPDALARAEGGFFFFIFFKN